MYCDLNVLDSIIFITQMCLHQLLPCVATLRRILNHSIWINITQLMTQKQELLQNRGQNLYLTFNLKFKGLMVGFSSWLLLDIRRARS